MKSSSSGSVHFVKLDKGEDILTLLTEYVNSNDIRSGYINAIGAVCNVELGYFDIEHKKYITKQFNGDHELLSCMGNIGELNKKKHIHLHAMISGADLLCYGGHLLKATVSVTCEVFMNVSSMDLERIYNNKMELNLLAPRQ